MKLKIIFAGFAYLLLAGTSCSLEEEVYDRLTAEQFFKNENDVIAAMAPVYSSFRSWLEWQSWWDIEESTDIAVTPTRGGNWFDGGIYQRMHLHTWTSYDPHFNGIWQSLYNNVNNCNRIIFQLEGATFEISGKESYIAELRTARAYLYYMLCNLYGNVPVIDKYDVPAGFLPETRERKEVFDFIVKELTESIPDLQEESGGPLYGRFNKWAGLTLLARMYLNAEAWTGVPMWTECSEVCSQVIDAGGFSLEGNFRSNFALNNDQSAEMIFAFPYDEKYTNGQTIYIAFQKTLHIEHLRKKYLAKTWADDGVMAVPSFIETFDPADKRLAGSFHIGQQYGAGGEQLFCTGLVASDLGKPLDYTNTLSDLTNAHEWEGYRFGKYEIKTGTERTCDNDWAAMRYAEVLLMKAEAELRLGNAEVAAGLVNEVRLRSFDNPRPVSASELSATVTVNEVAVPYGRMLQEWGWEFAGEGLRREQLIRFDNNFTKGSWTAHGPSQEFRRLFPIPQNALSANKNLIQNAGYN